MGTLTAVTGDTDLSVAVWVKFDKGNMDVTGKIIDCNYYSDYSYKGFQMYFDYASQKVRFACHQNDILGYAAATTDVGDDMWHFLVGVRDRTGSGKFKFYVDGVLDAEGQATHQGDIVASTGNAYYTLGSHCAKTMGYFEGYIDEVMVFDKALSPTEVEYLYENGM